MYSTRRRGGGSGGAALLHSFTLLNLFFVGICRGWGVSPTIIIKNTFGQNIKTRRTTTTTSPTRLSVKPNPDDVVDVDFERIKPNDQKGEQINMPPIAERPTTLLDLSLDSGDPKWKETRIPFCRSISEEYIDGKLAFMVELEGQQYGIAVPFDHAVAIVVEKGGKKNKKGETNQQQQEMTVQYIDPDKYEEKEDYQELMEIMAAQVQEQFGPDYTLRKTPKVLTISGDLNAITDDWERKLMPEPLTAKEFLEDASKDDEDELMDEFYKFMRDQLGDAEFEKTMKEEMSDEDREMAKMFEVPGAHPGDVTGLEELLKTIPDDLEGAGFVEEAKQFQPDTDGMALKLIAYNFGDGSKKYSLVKLLQPYVLVGKYIPGDDGADDEDHIGMQFELLTPDEEKVLVPRLEELCQKDLKEKGLTFQTPLSEKE
jgi:hypothetical protein